MKECYLLAISELGLINFLLFSLFPTVNVLLIRRKNICTSKGYCKKQVSLVHSKLQFLTSERHDFIFPFMHFKKKPHLSKKNPQKLYYEENLKNQTFNTRKCCLFLASANWQNLNLIFVLFANLQIRIIKFKWINIAKQRSMQRQNHYKTKLISNMDYTVLL